MNRENGKIRPIKDRKAKIRVEEGKEGVTEVFPEIGETASPGVMVRALFQGEMGSTLPITDLEGTIKIKIDPGEIVSIIEGRMAGIIMGESIEITDPSLPKEGTMGEETTATTTEIKFYVKDPQV